MKLTVPNQLTIIRIILTPVFIFYMLKNDQSSLLIASIVFFVASLTDWYDGYIARRFHQTSRWGQFMDPLADKILVSSALAVFAWLDYIYWWMVILVIIRDLLITLLRSFAIYIGKPIITSVLAKWKTFLQMGFVFALIIYLNIPGLPELKLSLQEQPYFIWTTISFSVVVILTTLSGIIYLIVNRSHWIELFRRAFDLVSKS